MVKALILDFDGTLVDSGKAYFPIYQSILAERGLKISQSEINKHFGKTAEDILIALFPELTTKEVKSIIEEKNKRFINSLDLVTKTPCVDVFLKKAIKFELAIATSSSMQTMKPLIERFGWSGLFKTIVLGYDVPRPKPAPDILLEVARRLGLKVSDCVFIGDSLFDARAAFNAKMIFLGVETGGFTREMFKQEGFKSYQSLCELTRAFF